MPAGSLSAFRFPAARWLSLALVVSVMPLAGVLAAERFATVARPDERREAAVEEAEPVFSKRTPESIADLIAIEERVSELSETLLPATVAVRVGPAQGSGVIVSRDGYILTAAHVSGDPGKKATVILSDGRKVRAVTLGANRGVDAGLMRITEDGEWPFAEMAEERGVEVGDWCLAVGHPNGHQKGRDPVVRLGRVVMVRKSVVQTDCTLVGGDSGGPLFDMEGRVVGIHSRIGTATTWNFHVPIASYTEDWDRLAKAEVFGETPEQGGALLGVNGEDDPQGALVTGVVPGFPAEDAGLKEGDVITKFEDREVDGFEDLALQVRKKNPGDKVTVTILRDGRTIVKSIELAGRE